MTFCAITTPFQFPLLIMKGTKVLTIDTLGMVNQGQNAYRYIYAYDNIHAYA